MGSLNEVERELRQLDGRREERSVASRVAVTAPTVDAHSPPEAKVALFRGLFRGRDDVYARRFESQRTGRSGYQPACGNEWVGGVCLKPRARCDACPHRRFLPLTDTVLRNHLLGRDPDDHSGRDFTVGVYPMLTDETCWFLAVDLDGRDWWDDAQALRETCRRHAVPVAVERSRSGAGAHCWVFFAEPVPAVLARRLGQALLTRTMERRPEIGLASYDRLFPSQDTLPRGGFGNLIALPLQQRPRADGNSVFLDADGHPWADQWAFLAAQPRMSPREIEVAVGAAEQGGEAVGVRLPVVDEYEDCPWAAPPSGRREAALPVGPFPTRVDLVIGNRVYVPKAGIGPSLRNHLVRLAAFQNPDFLQAQAMRLSTFGKPRVIGCCEDTPKYLALPRGCLDDVLALFETLGIEVGVTDERLAGPPVPFEFAGVLRPEQQQAADDMLRHDTGVLAASTAFGKTVVAAYMVARRGVSTLVIVYRRQLLDQWVGALSHFLGLAPEQVGQIGGGKRRPTGIIDVATIQSLVHEGVVDDVVADYAYVIVDECHHVSAVSFERVVGQARARYVTGLSATVARKDGHQPIVFMQCGPVRHRVDDRDQALQRPFLHRVIVRQTRFRPAVAATGPSPSIQDLYEMLARDDERNRMIVDDVVAAVAAGRCPVVLTERREHLDLLVESLAGRVEHVVAMMGGMGKRQRQRLAEQVASVPADESRVIVATGRYLGEGFDDERLDTLFLALPISWRGTLAQYAGRLHRLSATKQQVIIYDYVDAEVPVLARMHAKRRAGYRAIGYAIGDPGDEAQALQLAL